MIRFFSIYAAELSRELKRATRENGAENAVESMQGFLDALTLNDAELCHEGPFRAIADATMKRAKDRSEIYRKNISVRWERAKAPKPETQKATAKPKPEKHALDQGGFVRVTVDEETALRCKFGPDFERAVQILADYKESKGKAYRSDAAAMRGWVFDRIQEDKRRKEPQKSFAQQERERQGAICRSLLTEEQRRMYGL